MMPQVDACIGTELLGLAHTDNGGRDCRHEFEADEPSCAVIYLSVVVSNPTAGEVTGAGFVLDLHDVRTDYIHTGQPAGASLACFVTVWCAHFLPVALPRGKWRECPPVAVVLAGCVSVSVYQARVKLAIASIPNNPLVRCMASPAGSGDNGARSFGCTLCMQRLWGVRSRSLGGAGGNPTGREQQPLRVKKPPMIRWAWSGRPGRDSSVPCRLLHETPAKVQGMVELAAGWVVCPCNPPGALCTDVWMDGPPRWWC